MSGELPDGWDVAGLWEDGSYSEGNGWSDDELSDADAIVVSYHDDDWDKDGYLTIHGADDWETLADLVGDIDADVYFG